MKYIKNNLESFIWTMICVVLVGLSIRGLNVVTVMSGKIYWSILLTINTLSLLCWSYRFLNFRMDIAHMKYTWKHKLAFLMVEKQLLGHNTLRGYLHDCDKLFLYLFLDGEVVHNTHRSYSRHHIDKAFTESDYIQMIIDWECGRFTKPDKPLDAYDTLYKWFIELECVILPLLIRFNLTYGREKVSKEEPKEVPKKIEKSGLTLKQKIALYVERDRLKYKVK